MRRLYRCTDRNCSRYGTEIVIEPTSVGGDFHVWPALHCSGCDRLAMTWPAGQEPPLGKEHDL